MKTTTLSSLHFHVKGLCLSKIKEMWKPIPNFEGLYEISNLGRVRSLDREVRCGSRGVRKLKGRLMKIRLPTKTLRYCSVSLRKNSTQKTITIHRMVAARFDPEWDCSLEVDHIDGDIMNNRIDNLRMSTSQQQKFNSKSRGNSTSTFKGVSWDKRRDKWRSKIVIDGKEIFIGYFNCEKTAAIAYRELAKEKHGCFYKKNNILENIVEVE